MWLRTRTPAEAAFWKAISERFPEPHCSTTCLPYRVGKSGRIKGREREQHRTVNALGRVFRRLAHIDQDNLAPRHGIMDLLRRFCRYGR